MLVVIDGLENPSMKKLTYIIIAQHFYSMGLSKDCGINVSFFSPFAHPWKSCKPSLIDYIAYFVTIKILFLVTKRMLKGQLTNMLLS